LREKKIKVSLFPSFAIQKIKLLLNRWENKNIPKCADYAAIVFDLERSSIYKHIGFFPWPRKLALYSRARVSNLQNNQNTDTLSVSSG